MGLCRAEGESIAQPTKAFLLRIITKYNLQGPSNKPATGIMKFMSKDQVDANKGMADNNITSIAGTQEAEEDDEEMENEGDIPLNQVTCSISP